MREIVKEKIGLETLEDLRCYLSWTQSDYSADGRRIEAEVAELADGQSIRIPVSEVSDKAVCVRKEGDRYWLRMEGAELLPVVDCEDHSAKFADSIEMAIVDIRQHVAREEGTF